MFSATSEDKLEVKHLSQARQELVTKLDHPITFLPVILSLRMFGWRLETTSE